MPRMRNLSIVALTVSFIASGCAESGPGVAPLPPGASIEVPKTKINQSTDAVKARKVGE